MKWLALLLAAVLVCGCFEDPIVTEAVEKKDPSLCSQLERERDEKDCVVKVAKKAQDKRICDRYFSKDKGYLGGCYTDVARESGDLTLCDEAGRLYDGDLQKWSCYKDIGVKKQDPSICAKIGNKNDKARCYATLGDRMDDTNLCHEAAKADKGDVMVDSCYKKQAEKKEDDGLCQHIQSQSSRDSCYLTIAEKTKNPNPCLKMSEDYGHYCTGKITGNPQECELAGEHKGRCQAESALTAKNSAACADIEHPLYKNDCYTKVAAATGNQNLCDKVLETRRFDCMMGAARTAKVPEICEDVAPEKQDYCYKEMAYELKKTSVCDNIKAEKERENCRLRIVKSSTTTTLAYENKSIIGKGKEKIEDYAANVISGIIGF